MSHPPPGPARRARWLILAVCGGAALHCQEVDPGAAQEHALFLEEQRLVQTPLSYRDDSPRLRPSGAFVEGDAASPRVWLYSRDHARQFGLRLTPEGWRPAETRSGPRGTARCVAIGTASVASVCVGTHEPGGLWTPAPASFRSPLPTRGGFVDVAFAAETQSIVVLDAIEPALHQLSLGGALLRTTPLPSEAARMALLPEGRVAIAGHTAPTLYVVSPQGAPTPLTLGVPVRDLLYDPGRRILWTVGPIDRRVRRRDGPIENLSSCVYGFALADLGAERVTPRVAIDLGPERLVDGIALALWGEHLVVVASGSDAVWVLDPDTRHGERVATGFTPQTPAVIGDDLIVPNRLGDSVTVLHRESPTAKVADRAKTLPLGPPHPRGDDAESLGELLFYKKVLWADVPRNDFTCNSCHWEGLTDHRVQPGFREARWEVTRPVLGIGMVAPVFSPMGSRTLAHAVRGLFEALDVRTWTAKPSFEEPLRIAFPEGERLVSTHDARVALLTFLVRSPPRRGPLRAPAGRFSNDARAGFAIFARDCLRCHEAVPDLRTRTTTRVAPEEILRHLERAPLAFGAPFFNRAGVEPYFTPQGNRISPLLALYRGGPFFTNGSAATLADVVRRSFPTHRRVHDGTASLAPHYSEAEVRLLVAFLLSI